MIRRAAAAAAATFAIACAGGEGAVPRAIVVVVDTLRRDALGCYGDPNANLPGATPAIDALARDGTRFERAISSSGWTLPAMASLLTGAWPSVHKALGKHTRLTPISRDVTTGAEVLQRAGFRTVAVANAAFVSPYLGLARGFDVFDHRHAYNREIRRADASVERALELAAAEPEAPLFLLLHLFDPHLDYDPPEALARRFTGAPREPAPPLSGRQCRALAPDGGVPSPEDVAYLRGLYQAEVAFVDRAIGRLLDGLRALGMYEDSLIVLTSDHGEEFWEHGGFEHGHTLHEELVRVPLIVKLPRGLPRRPAVEAQVRVLDVLPTLFDVYEVEKPDGFVGETLTGLIAGVDDASRIAWSESTLYGANQLALRDERFTFVVDAAPGAAVPTALYEHAVDPHETRNLVAERPQEALRMRERMQAFLAALERDAARTRPGAVRNLAPGRLDELEESLRALGYLEE